jgi:Tol biopolymer transport system component
MPGSLRLFRSAAICGLLLAVAFGITTSATSEPLGTVKRVDAAYDGGVANTEAGSIAVLSASGRYVAFTSQASDIIEGDGNGHVDVFWRDLQTGATKLVSISRTGTFTPDGTTDWVDMTPDGRYVVFCSSDSTLISTDTNSSFDVFRRDMVSEETTLVSWTSHGVQGNGDSNQGSISDDGRYVAFTADTAVNLVPGHVYSTGDRASILKDMVSGETTCVSMGYDGSRAHQDCWSPTISGDGKKVAFMSYADNIVSGDTPGSTNGDIFIRDLASGAAERVDCKPDGSEASANCDTDHLDVDYTGRHVVFQSRQKDLVPAGTVGPDAQVYLRDTIADETTAVATTAGGGLVNGETLRPAISRDGRIVTFLSAASNITTSDANGNQDLFARDMQTGVTSLISLNENAEQLDAFVNGHAISADGAAVLFATYASNILPPGDPAPNMHLYWRQFRPGDAQAPQVSSNAVASYAGGSASISITATDGAAGSGVDSIQYRVDSAATQTVSGAVATLTVGAGSHTLDFLALDVSGNASAVQHVAFTVAPAVTAAWVSTPSCSAKWSRKKSYAVSGVLKPQRAAGSRPVRIYKYRLVGKKWKPAGYVLASVTNAGADSKYSAKLKLTVKGKWRLRAYAPADALHTAAWSSGYRAVTVR